MKYRALAIDLDGTLLTGEEIAPGNADAVRAASAAGLKVIIATARWKEMALSIGASMGLADPVIACSGAQVYDPATGADVFDVRLPADFTAALYQLCNEERCVATITTGGQVTIKLDGEPDPALLREEMRWTSSLDFDAADTPRVAAIQGSKVNARIQAELAPAFGDRVNIFDSVGPTGKIIVTITDKTADKGVALSATCKHLNIPPDSVVAFGDAENDLAMFSVAGAAVAMGQADDEVKSAAAFVSVPHHEGGVAHAINHLLANGSF